MKRGIFIGCFNPPHNGHIHIAQHLLEKKILDNITFVPTGNNYNKKDLIDANHRFKMLNILINNKDNFMVSDIEIKHDKQNYTYQTLDEMKRLYPKDDIYLIVGSDNLAYFDQWMKYEYILSNYMVIVVKRDDDDLSKMINKSAVISKYKDNIIPFYIENSSKLSSTFVRDLLYRRQDVSTYLDNNVYNYIKENNLYINLGE